MGIVLKKAAAKGLLPPIYRAIYLSDCSPAKTLNFTKPNPFFPNNPTWH